MLSKAHGTSFSKSSLVYVCVFMSIYVYIYGRSVLNVWLVPECTILNTRFWIAF